MATILIVDDEENLRAILSIALGESHKIIEASNGEEGLREFEKHLPELIITDLTMPVMNGIDMIRKVRASNSQVKIVVISTFHHFGETEILKAGADLCLRKPVDLKTLEQAIAPLFKAQREATAKGSN
jgi:YesN/AraC family two-component response regulator